MLLEKRGTRPLRVANFSRRRAISGAVCWSYRLVDLVVDVAPPDGANTITFDSGGEFADHKAIEEALVAKAYFVHPYSSWDRMKTAMGCYGSSYRRGQT